MQRRAELDALRGVLLILMTLSHLPTRLNAYADQPLGFVSTAEGFVFLSAFVTGLAFFGATRDPANGVRQRLWKRAFTIYRWHLALLLFALTVAAGLAVLTGRPTLRNLLSFYFESPVHAALAAPVLLYQPPLLDILPMYILFLAITPWVLATARNRGWPLVLGISAAIWLLAQLNGRELLYSYFQHHTGWPFAVHSLGSFDWLAWQLMWIAGLWIGSCVSERDGPLVSAPARRPLLIAASCVGAFFLIWRHRLGGFWIDLGDHFALLDKWHLGALRVMNFAAVSVVFAFVVLPLMARVRLGLLAMLGRASLPAFTAHLLVCILSLALVVDDLPLSLKEEMLVLSVTFAVMLFVASRSEVNTRAEAKRRASAYAST